MKVFRLGWMGEKLLLLVLLLVLLEFWVVVRLVE